MYLFKVNNGNTRKRYEICSELTIKPPELGPAFKKLKAGRRSGVFIVNYEHISHLF